MPGGIVTILTPASDRRLATAADVRAELGASSAPVDNDLNALILQASDMIAGACGGRVFARETLREVFRLEAPASAILLSRSPVTAVGSLVEGGASLVEGQDFEVDGAAGLIHRLSGDHRTPWCRVKVAVEYTAGWLLPSAAAAGDAGALPTDIRRICIERVARMVNGRGRDATIRSEGAQDVGQISFFDPNKLSDEEDRALAAYKVYRL